MNCHPSPNDQYALIAETLQRFAYAIVPTQILVIE
jgi:hypothetical protein